MIKEKNIFLVGIKGVAMTSLALILKKMGKNVLGSDTSEDFITTNNLVKHKILCFPNFARESLPKDTELVVYSAAHKGLANPQVQEALARKIKVISQAEFLRDLLADFKNTLAVCGCHGKTTTAALLSYALFNLGVSPSYFVGSSGFNDFEGGDFQKKDYFVFEADEYGVNPPLDKTPKLTFLKPNYIICTNIDFDHPDVYQDINEVKETFYKFFDVALQRKGSKIFICNDNRNSVEVAGKLKKEGYLTYGFDEKADYRITNYKTVENGSSFILVDPDNNHYDFKICLFGEKNISNSAGAIGLLHHLGFPLEKIRSAVAGFTGAKRRFEKIAYLNDIYLFDDYAHHPKEIETTLKAAQERFPQRRIILIFQPHTYSRTQALLFDFRKSLALADFGLVLPIFPSAREDKSNFKITSQDLVSGIKNLSYAASKEEFLKQLGAILKKGDVIFTMGAGDVYKLKDDIIKTISKIKGQK